MSSAGQSPSVMDASPTDEAIRAVSNALKLGSSLLFTWGIALGIRLLLPRILGPERFGQFSDADALTTVVFVALTLGTDMYIRKEVSVRPDHANDFIGGVAL